MCVCVCGMCTISVRVTCMSPDLTNLFIRWHNSKPADTGPAGCLLMAKRGDSGGSKSVLGSQAVGTPLMRRLRSAWSRVAGQWARTHEHRCHELNYQLVYRMSFTPHSPQTDASKHSGMDSLMESYIAAKCYYTGFHDSLNDPSSSLNRSSRGPPLPGRPH